jgi:hypothetical protein
MAKQYPKAEINEYLLQRINPMEILLPKTVMGGSNDLDFTIKRCKELAEADKGKSHLEFYRVVTNKGEVVFLSHVNFDEVTHFDMREETSNGNQEENR